MDDEGRFSPEVGETGCRAGTLSRVVFRAERDLGKRGGLTTVERARLKVHK